MKYLLQGLLILAKYWPESTDAHAQHEVLYVGGNKAEMSAEDVEAMQSIPRWHYDEDFDCWYFNT